MEYNIYNTRYGKFLLNPDDLVSQELIKNKMWEDTLLAVFDKYVTKDSIIIEVGSYIGDHTVYLSKICKFVIAFEGYRRNFYHMLTNLLINDCWNVEPINMIVGNGETVKPAREKDGDEWYPDWDHNAAGARFTIGDELRTTKLDDFGLHKVDLIKIDAEGMDLSVMKGCINLINNDKPPIIFEYNGLVAEPFEEYEKFLNSIGYKYTKIDNWNYLAEWKG